MKIITKEETEATLKGNWYRHANLVLEELKKLEVGQTLKVEIEDWKLKSPIGSQISSLKRYGMSFSMRTLRDGSGWVITRVK